MKQGIVMVMGLLAAMGCSSSPETVFDNADVSIVRHPNGLMIGSTADKTTIYIIEGDDCALLIDTGTEIAALDSIVAAVTDKPVTVVLTHNHYDHAGGIGYFDEIYLNPKDQAIYTETMADYSGVVHDVVEGDSFDLGGTVIDVYEMPGHTPGSIVLVNRESGYAVTGDAFGSGAVWMQLEPHVPMTTYASSCRRMAALMDSLGVSDLYVGHYPYPRKAFHSDYLDDMATLADRIAAGDIAEATDTWEQPRPFYHPKSMKLNEAEIIFNSRNINSPSRKFVVLKLDDVHDGDGPEGVTERMDRAMRFVEDNGLHAAFGIIGYSLEGDNPKYFDWIRRHAAGSNIEFWNHGYHNRNGVDDYAEFEQPYDDQLRALRLTDSLALSKLGLELTAWGPHWTGINIDTERALNEVPRIRFAFGYPRRQSAYTGYVLPEKIQMEYPVHNPDFEQFRSNFEGVWADAAVFYLQGHPNSWDDVRWQNFVDIIRYLQEHEVTFITPSELLRLSGN